MKKDLNTVTAFACAVLLLALGTMVLVSSGCPNDDVYNLSLESSVPTFPGSYGISLKWKAPSGEVKVRVGIYSFRSDDSFRADYWQWGSKENGLNSLVKADVIGEGDPFDYDDSYRQIVTQRKFLNLDLTTEFGSWDSFSDGTRVRINWENGAQEWWKLTWQDETINKLEAYYLSTAANWRDFYLENPSDPVGMQYSPYYFRRKLNAENTGFALGCQESFDNNAQPTSAFEDRYRGLLFKRNYYPTATNNGKGDWAMDVGQQLKLTDEDVWRGVIWGSDEGHLVFSYLDVPSGSTDLKSRRVHMQVDHDSDNDEHIEDESGHVYLGFQIIDANDDVRGFTFVEAAYDPDQDAYMMLSAMYLLDDLSEVAKTGILVDPQR